MNTNLRLALAVTLALMASACMAQDGTARQFDWTSLTLLLIGFVGAEAAKDNHKRKQAIKDWEKGGSKGPRPTFAWALAIPRWLRGVAFAFMADPLWNQLVTVLNGKQ